MIFELFSSGTFQVSRASIIFLPAVEFVEQRYAQCLPLSVFFFVTAIAYGRFDAIPLANFCNLTIRDCHRLDPLSASDLENFLLYPVLSDFQSYLLSI